MLPRLMWVDAGVPGKNPRRRPAGDHILSHTTTVDHMDRTRVATVKSGCIFHCATWTSRWLSTGYIDKVDMHRVQCLSRRDMGGQQITYLHVTYIKYSDTIFKDVYYYFVDKYFIYLSF